MTYVVAVYEEDLAYGGPEEGGWYFSTGRLIGVNRTFKSEEKAFEYCRRFNRRLRARGERLGVRDVSSVIYDGGHWVAHVYEDHAPKFFPEERPHYC